jgi:ubiquinone/menaquinone biosynthesis C-methylase UbiE
MPRFPADLSTLDLASLERASNRDILLRTVDFAGKEVVDIGCGDSRLARLIADEGQAQSVTGIECSPRQLAKANALPTHPKVTVLDAVAQALPLADASVDVAVFFNSLHHLPQQAMVQGLAEASRVLRPGGVVYISEPVAAGSFFTVCKPVDDETEVRAQAQAAIAAACAGGLGLHKSADIVYLHQVKMPSFEAFRDRIVSANADRDAIFAQNDQALRALFTQVGQPLDDGGFLFDQPGHVCLLHKD